MFSNSTITCFFLISLIWTLGFSIPLGLSLIHILNKAGFVKSTRGAQGGYRLARDPAEYTVGQILRLTEGSLNPVPCLDSCGGTADCLRYDTCETVDVWKQLADAINGVVDSITIADLAEKHAKRMESMNYMI